MAAILLRVSAVAESTDVYKAGAKDWMELNNAMDPVPWRQPPTLRERAEGRDQICHRVLQLAEAFFHKYPTDPRRWKAAFFYIAVEPLFATDYPEETRSGVTFDAYCRGLPVNEAARAEWIQKGEKFAAEILAAANASPAVKEETEFVLFHRDYRAVAAAQSAGESADWAGLQAKFEAHLQKYENEPSLRGILPRRADTYLSNLVEIVPRAVLLEAAERLRRVSDSPKIRESTDNAIWKRGLKDQPLAMKFTAVDGREVDVAKLRGKVVLIDFWATWCGPCKAELPNVKATFDRYHARGFEVIGISLDAEKDRQAFIDYCRTQGVSWPQHFDGKYWQNQFAVAHGVKAIPATFLIDKAGKLVSTSARGEQLEVMVKRLLEIP